MTVGVVGLGRFGRLWAEILQSQASVLAWSRSGTRVPGVQIAPLSEVCRCDTVFLCTAIGATADVTARIAPLLGPTTVVADTASVKVWPMSQLERRLAPDTAFFGTHPMFGPDSWGSGDRPTIALCPGRNDSEVRAEWSERFAQLGMEVLPLSAEEHDRQAAASQGITHFIGRMLDAVDARPSPLATHGYRRLLDVRQQTCNDTDRLFHDLLRYNPYAKRAVDALLEAASTLHADVFDSEHRSP